MPTSRRFADLGTANILKDGQTQTFPQPVKFDEYAIPKGLVRLRNVLFICSQNKLRSPTAEQVFSTWSELECASAGLNNDAENPVTPELLEWADIIFVMEKAHRSKLSAKFRTHLKDARVVCLDIPDDYEYMDPSLIQILKSKVPRYLQSGQGH